MRDFLDHIRDDLRKLGIEDYKFTKTGNFNEDINIIDYYTIHFSNLDDMNLYRLAGEWARTYINLRFVRLEVKEENVRYA